MSNFVINPYSFTSEFSPSDISDLFAWYDFSDSTTVTKDVGTLRVSQVDDKSGNDFNLTSTGDDQPLWVSADQNGYDVLNFAGDRFMKAAFTAVSQPNTIAIACVIPTEGNQSLWDGSGGGKCRFRTVDGTAETIGINGGSLLTSNGVSGLFETWAYVINIYNNSSSIIRINGSLNKTGNAGTNDQEGFTIAAQNNDSGFANVKMGEIIAYNKVVTGTELTDLETYLSDKWDI